MDPYSKPSFSFLNRLARAVWGLIWIIFFRFSPRPCHFWRCWLMRLFGAKIGKGCAIYPSAKIWAPWNLVCEDTVAIAEGVEIYNPATVYLKSHAILSQGAYLCGASHDLDNKDFPLFANEIHVGAYAWVCARATVMAGVKIQDGGVVGLGGVATKDIPSWEIHIGIPAKFLRNRRHEYGKY